MLISPFFHPHIGGSQRYMEELYSHLLRLHRRVSVDVIAYNTDNAPAHETYRGMRVYRVPCWHILPGQFALPYPVPLFVLLWQLAKKRYEVVHTHIRFFDGTWWAWIYAKIIKARCIFTEHVASHPVHPNTKVQSVAKLVDATVASWTIPRYDMITATNRAAREFLKYTYQLIKPVSVLYGGVDTAFFTPKRSRIRIIPRVSKRFTSGDIVITYAGRLIWSKGIAHLYNAISGLIPTVSSRVYFVFVGGGPLENDLRGEITKDRLGKRVFLTGALDSRGVRKVLQATDIFVHPSHHNEGFPNVILEAGATGCFVIATDNAGVREVVEHKKTGYLIGQKNEKDIRGGIRWALSYPQKRKKIAGQMRRLMEAKFDWNLLASKFYAVLYRLVRT